MRDETFDHIDEAIFYMGEALEDETISQVERTELTKALHILEDIKENR